MILGLLLISEMTGKEFFIHIETKKIKWKLEQKHRPQLL